MEKENVIKDTEREMRKQKIIELLTKVLNKYDAEHVFQIKRDTNREHYKELTNELCKISTELPAKEPTMFLEKKDNPDFYNVKEWQVEAAFNGRIQKMKPFIAATCFLYLDKEASLKGYEKEIRELCKGDTPDVHLLEEENEGLREKLLVYSNENKRLQQSNETLQQQYDSLKREQDVLQIQFKTKRKNASLLACLLIGLTAIIFIWSSLSWKKDAAAMVAVNQSLQHRFDSSLQAWNAIKKDFRILPYHATPAQLALYEGNFLAYAPSPQVRSSTPLAERRNKVVSNFVHFTQKDGYLTFERHGPGFDQKGVLQFESSTVASLSAYTLDPDRPDTVISPKHSVWTITNGKPDTVLLSTTWSFDPEEKNRPIASREVYQRLGKGGAPREERRTPAAYACKCVLFHWTKDGKNITDTARTQPISSLPEPYHKLLTIESILMLGPDDKNRLTRE
jgi:FtsZ-binding cell division protein ZapB